MRSFVCIVLSVLCLLAGCRKVEQPAKEEDKKAEEFDCKPYSKEFETGPLKVRLSLDRTHLRLDEDILLTLEAEAPEEYAVDFPKLDTGIRQFQWDLLASSVPELRDGGVMYYKRQVSLSAYVVPDKLAISPMVVVFTKNGGTDAPKKYEVSTDEVELSVEMPPEEYWKTLDVDRTPSETPRTMLEPKSVKNWILYTIAGVVLVLVAIGIYLVKARRKKVQEIVLPPPEDIAMEQLRRLVEEKLVENGAIMEFYNRIQEILRSYIENKYDIHAPKRTTQEFMDELRAAKNSPVAKYQKQLDSFLTHCDLVRFATHQPDKTEIQRTFNACRDFISATSGNYV